MERGSYKREITAYKALEKLQILCSRAEKSSADAARLMNRWGVPKDKIESVIKKLIADRYIDDRRFVEAYVRDKSKFSSWGARKISDTLIMRGLDGDLVREVVREQISEEDIKVKLEAMLRKKYIEVQKKEDNPFKIKDKLYRLAVSRGFSYDDISSIIDDLNI